MNRPVNKSKVATGLHYFLLLHLLHISLLYSPSCQILNTVYDRKMRSVLTHDTAEKIL